MKPRKSMVWRKRNTAYKFGNTQPYMRSKSVMVWAGFGASGVGDIVIISGNMNGMMYHDLLKNHLKMSAKKIGLKKGWKLLQDNDPKHKCKFVQSYLQDMKIECIPHPPQSPDMNPIENLWDYIDRQIPVSKRTFLYSYIHKGNN